MERKFYRLKKHYAWNTLGITERNLLQHAVVSNGDIELRETSLCVHHIKHVQKTSGFAVTRRLKKSRIFEG